ncbi:AAA domain-containing protein [Rhizoctonia solani AG-1 IA]|uniref:AAA domain-containing protein n=1 Tax=Thanatephorus cucumeris (strain AG1-IA) TaxID=983506 RepID=L8WIF8_THACA|nr:AAA domain-containing protein [Rhizoctonia solani AG-1 IA]
MLKFGRVFSRTVVPREAGMTVHPRRFRRNDITQAQLRPFTGTSIVLQDIKAQPLGAPNDNHLPDERTVFFGGIAYVAWYKADVLDKIEEAFAPGYDPVLELMSYPSRSGELDEDDGLGVRNYALSTWQVKRKEQALVDSIMEGKEAGHYFLFLGPNGSGKTTMMVDAMRKVVADGVTICDAHPDLEVFRLRLGKALNYEYNEDSQTGLFQRRDPREGGPRLDIERAMNKLEKVAIRRARKTGRPIVLIINDIHLFNNDDDGRLLLQQLQQRAENWAESGMNSPFGLRDMGAYQRVKVNWNSSGQIANRMQIFSVKDLEPVEAFNALKKLRQESIGREELESDQVLVRAAKTSGMTAIQSSAYQYRLIFSGGRLAHLNRLARSRDINHTVQNLKNNEKSWLLSNFGLIPDCDDDVEEEAKWASCTWLLLQEFVRRRVEMEKRLDLESSESGGPANVDHIPVPSIPYFECRRIMTRGDFLARTSRMYPGDMPHNFGSIGLDQMNIISIDVIRLDSMLTLEAAREVVSEPEFEPMLKGVLTRVDELESLGRTRELTFKDVKPGDRIKVVIDKTGRIDK